VQGSLYLCKKFNEAGISSAHIDGSNCYLDGREVKSTKEVRDEIRHRSELGDIRVVCNRFVLREGVDWPHLAHCIFATVFGSVTTYVQAGGRVVRNHDSLKHVTIQDHGGNWWRFGSLNEDRQWDLNLGVRTWQMLREDENREGDRENPRVCPKCDALWTRGLQCPYCKFKYDHSVTRRKVLQSDGMLRPMEIGQWRKRRTLATTEALKREWTGKLYGSRRYSADRTYAQVYHDFARTHDWQYPPRDWPGMPLALIDWYLPVNAVPVSRLHSPQLPAEKVCDY